MHRTEGEVPRRGPNMAISIPSMIDIPPDHDVRGYARPETEVAITGRAESENLI